MEIISLLLFHKLYHFHDSTQNKQLRTLIQLIFDKQTDKEYRVFSLQKLTYHFRHFLSVGDN